MTALADPAVSHESTPSRSRPAYVAGGVAAAAAVVAAGLYFGAPAAGFGGFGGDDTPSDPAALYTVAAERGPLVIGILETGTIKAADQVTIQSQIEGQATILDLVREGKRVKQGELLIAFDTSKLEDDRVTAEIRVRNMEADFIQAQEELAVRLNQAEADVSSAELDLRFSIEDEKKYLEGDYPKDLMEAENKITIAQEEHRRSTESRQGSERLYEAGFVSLTELDADRLAERRNQLNLELAVKTRDLLAGWTHNRKLDQFESDREQKTMALERARRKAKADIAQGEARVAAREAELRREEQRLARINTQIGNGRIHAPADGMVVYATSNAGGWRGNAEPLEAGQQVRERQELIHLPTDRDRLAEVSIHESNLDKVAVGMWARVTIDALPGQTFWGKVERIAPLPDASVSFFNPDLKVYPTQIRIEGEHPNLRTGMSCRAEIVVARFEDAVSVPVQSVVRVGGRPSVFAVNGNRVERRDVTVGPDNNARVVITSGLAAGDRVSLTPPLADTGARDAIDMNDLPPEAVADPVPVAPAQAASPEGDAAEVEHEPVTVADFREAIPVVMQRATEAERTRMGELMQAGDRGAMMAYGRMLLTKYKVTIDRPAPSDEVPSEPRP